ncbi:class I SAM-dependent methyltransferase [Candidatus Woesearchaeota archaeon]|nr:class I SAM-dependent methyltransferase [Candidatus Woesearchaeota archaeon]
MVAELMDADFDRIKTAYTHFESRLKAEGRGLVFRTRKGIYGTTPLDQIFRFFKEINLQNYSNFIDLGCGDGRVVLTASLFTKATGIEFDAELLERAKAIRDSLNLQCGLIQGDYLAIDLSKYDIVFMNPDHEFGELDSKLARELKGPLFIYNDIFAPSSLRKGKKFWPGQVPVIMFTRE